MTLHVLSAAGTFIFSKAATMSFANPMVLTFSRGIGAAFILLVLSGWKIPKPDFTLKEWLGLLGLGILLVPLNQYCFLKGLEFSVPGHSALLYAMTPLGVLIFSSIKTRKMPSVQKLSGVIVAFSGVMIILRPWETGIRVTELRTGDFWLALAVVCWVIYTVMAGDICRRKNIVTVTAWSLILGVGAMAPMAVGEMINFNFSHVSAAGWFGLGYMIIITSILMMTLWNILLKHLSPVQVAITTNAQPPATLILAAAAAATGLLPGNQDLGPAFITGMALSLSGVIIIQKARA